MLDTPQVALLATIIDGNAYRERLTMPKMVVNSANDEFFMPDDTRYWWANMTEPKHFMIMPNTEHTTATGILEELPSIKAFLKATLANKTIP